MSIDWKRIAKPQPDGYDSEVIASILYEKYGWKKIAPSTELTLCNGAVGITEDKLVLLGRTSKDGPMQDGMSYMTPELATNIDRFLMAWPDGSLMLQNFLDEYWAKWSENMSPQARGCSSGHTVMSDNLRYQSTEEKLILNAVYVTANDPQGCCEGTYHEVGHARLESIGIDIDKDNPGAGSFELDWNDKFVANLIRAGYQCKTDQDIVDNWFRSICQNVVLENYEQEQADPEKRASNRKDLGNGRTEIS